MYRNGPAQPTQEQEFMDDQYAPPPPLFISRADVGRAVTFPEAVGRLEGFLQEGFTRILQSRGVVNQETRRL